MSYTKKEYNEDPVFYCSNCLGLAIKEISNSKMYVCLDCGHPKQEEDTIENHSILYAKEYGKSFLSLEDSNNEDSQ